MVSKFTEGYIWQNEPFLLSLNRTLSNGTPILCLKGTTSFGDNIEDEWFIVFLLRHITCTINGVIAKVTDNDGQFLLIEAADHLPPWLQSEDNSVNRVFIYNGILHIIPQPDSPGTLGLYPITTPELSTAIAIVANDMLPTAASEHVQAAIGRRLDIYPVLIFLYSPNI